MLFDLSHDINCRLVDHGFIEPRDALHVDGSDIMEWIRSLQWRRDILSMTHPRGSYQLTLSIGVGVVLSPGRIVPIDGASVSYFSRKKGYYRIPSTRLPFGHLLRRRLTTRVLMDVEKGMEWLDQYTTAVRCLKRMDSADRNGCAVGTEPWNEVRTMLLELASSSEP